MKHHPLCKSKEKSREYHIYIIDRFFDGEILVEVRCLECGAFIKGRFHPDNFIEAIK